MGDIADQIVRVESGGDPNAQNPLSSAGGAGQFIDSTWLDMLAKHRPDLTGSREDLLALKSDPSLSHEMTAAYAADNAGILKGAGLPVTPGTTYLAHFAGPQGAVGLLNADPNAPASSVLGQGFAKANPSMANYTAGQVAAWADRKMGGGSAPLSMAGPSAPGAPTSLAPDNPTPAPAPTVLQGSGGGGGSPSPALTAVPQIQNFLQKRPIYQIAKAAPFSFGGLPS